MYKTSEGERITQSQLDGRIRKAKKQKLEAFYTEHGYYFCEDCGRVDRIIDCSHDISVQKCKDTSRAELAYDTGNITLRCRACHQRYDGLDLRW